MAIYEEVTEVSAAQILAMHTTPIVFSPTPVAAQFIVPLEILLTFHFGATPYAVTNNDPIIYASTVEEWNGANTGYWYTFNAGPFEGVGVNNPNATWRAISGADDMDFSGLTGSPWALFKNALNPLTSGNGTATIRMLYTTLDA